MREGGRRVARRRRKRKRRRRKRRERRKRRRRVRASLFQSIVVVVMCVWVRKYRERVNNSWQANQSCHVRVVYVKKKNRQRSEIVSNNPPGRDKLVTYTC